MKFFTLSLWTLLLAFVTAAEKARYDNYRVYEISIDNDQQLALMQQIEKYPDGVSNNVKLC